MDQFVYNSPLEINTRPRHGSSVPVYEDNELQRSMNAIMSEFLENDQSYLSDMSELLIMVNLQIETYDVNYDLSDDENKARAKNLADLFHIVKKLISKHKELKVAVQTCKPGHLSTLVLKWLCITLPYYKQFVGLYQFSYDLLPVYNSLIKRPLVKIRYINKLLLHIIEAETSFNKRSFSSSIVNDLRSVQKETESLLNYARSKDELERNKACLKSITFNKVKSIYDLTPIAFSFSNDESNVRSMVLQDCFLRLSHPLLNQTFFYKINLIHLKKPNSLAIVKLNENPNTKSLLFPCIRPQELVINKINHKDMIISTYHSQNGKIKLDFKISREFSNWSKSFCELFEMSNEFQNTEVIDYKTCENLNTCGIFVPIALKKTQPLIISNKENTQPKETTPVLISPVDPVFRKDREIASPSALSKASIVSQDKENTEVDNYSDSDSDVEIEDDKSQNKTPKFNAQTFAKNYEHTLTLTKNRSTESGKNPSPVKSSKSSLFNLFGFKKNNGSKNDLSLGEITNTTSKKSITSSHSLSSISTAKSIKSSSSSKKSVTGLALLSASTLSLPLSSSASSSSISGKVEELPQDIKSIVNDNKSICSNPIKLSKWSFSKWQLVDDHQGQIKLEFVHFENKSYVLIYHSVANELEITAGNLISVIPITDRFEFKSSNSNNINFECSQIYSSISKPNTKSNLLINCLNLAAKSSILKLLSMIQSGKLSAQMPLSKSTLNTMSNSSSNQSDLSHMSNSTTMTSFGSDGSLNDIINLGKPSLGTKHQNCSSGSLPITLTNQKNTSMYSLGNSANSSAVSVANSNKSVLSFPKPISKKNIARQELMVFKNKGLVDILSLDREVCASDVSVSFYKMFNADSNKDMKVKIEEEEGLIHSSEVFRTNAELKLGFGENDYLLKFQNPGDFELVSDLFA